MHRPRLRRPTPTRQCIVYSPTTSTTITTTMTTVGLDGKDEAAVAGPSTSITPPNRDGSAVRRRSPSQRATTAALTFSPAVSTRLTRVPVPVAAAAAATQRGDLTNADVQLLRQTRSLFLGGRGLRSIRHIRHLQAMRSLRHLSLHMNVITELEVDGLLGLPLLVELDLSANNIATLPSGCLNGLRRLERLNLSSNLLTSIAPGVLSPLSSLQWLSLGFNSLTSLDGLHSLPEEAPLRFVDLSANRIASIEEVFTALSLQRSHIEELRLKVRRLPAEAEMVAGDATASFPPFPQHQQQQQRHVAENDFCLDGTRYVEQLLKYFPSLTVVDGVPYGLDVLATLREAQAEELHHQGSSDAEAAMEAAEDRGEVEKLTLYSRHHRGNGLSDQAFQDLLKTPLPHLLISDRRATTPPLVSSSTTTTTTTGNTSSSSSEAEEAKRRPSRQRQQRDTASTSGEELTPSMPLLRRRRRPPSQPRRASLRRTPEAASSTPTPKAPRNIIVSSEPQPSAVLASGGYRPCVSTPTPTDADAALRPVRRLTFAEAEVDDVSSPSGHKSDRGDDEGVVAPAAPSSPPWRFKRVCRGVNTELIGTSVEAVQTAQMKALQEQVALHLSTIRDLQQHLHVTRRQYMEAQREAAHRQHQTQSQVSALKDELMRRSHEALIVRQKHRAEVAAAAATSEKELSSRLEAARKDGVSASRTEWESVVEQLRVCNAELQQEVAALQMTVSQKTATSEALRQTVTMMEGELTNLQRHSNHMWSIARQLHDVVEEEMVARRSLEAELFQIWMQQLPVAVLRATVADAGRQLHQQRVTSDAEQEALHKRLVAVEESWAGALHDAQEELARLQDMMQQLQLEKCTVTDAVPTEDGAAPLDLVSTPPPPQQEQHLQLLSAEHREMCQLRQALEVATTTQQAMSKENTRLLQRVSELEAELLERRCVEEEAAVVLERERGNLHRTIRTLRDDIEKKSEALDALEKEARSKIEEKRRRVAEVEEALDSITTQHQRTTELNVSYRQQLEAATQRLEELREKEESQSACITTQSARLAVLEAAQKAADESLAAQKAQAEQHDADTGKLLNALTMAREQLVNLHNAYQQATTDAERKAEQLVRQAVETEDLRRRLDQVQEESRAKQKATFAMLSQFMGAAEAI